MLLREVQQAPSLSAGHGQLDLNCCSSAELQLQICSCTVAPAAQKSQRTHFCLQDMASWTRDGIAGLQSVVLYSLPELDGAIDTVPLGGLVGNNIFLVAERVKRLSQRIKKWVHLRQIQAQVRVTEPNA